MKLILLFILLPAVCFGQAFGYHDLPWMMKVQPVASGGGISYLISEDCEGTGTPAGWNNGASTVNWDYATSPAPLVGSQSVLVGIVETFANFTAQSDVWAYFQMNLSAISGSQFIFSFRTSADVKVCSLRVLSDGTFRIYDTSQTVTASTSAGFISTSTTYHVWVHRTKGSGANELVEAYVATTATKPGSPTVTLNTGTGTADAARVAVEGWNDGNYIYDKIRVAASSIGSNPT